MTIYEALARRSFREESSTESFADRGPRIPRVTSQGAPFHRLRPQGNSTTGEFFAVNPTIPRESFMSHERTSSVCKASCVETREHEVPDSKKLTLQKLNVANAVQSISNHDNTNLPSITMIGSSIDTGHESNRIKTRLLLLLLLALCGLYSTISF